MPFSPMVRPGRSDTCCDPWSEWRVQPAGGLPAGDRHLECLVGQPGVHAVGHVFGNV